MSLKRKISKQKVPNSAKTIRNIKLNGGSIVNNIDENTDILVYQPSSEVNEILDMARRLNIEVLTLGEFNRRLIMNR